MRAGLALSAADAGNRVALRKVKTGTIDKMHPYMIFHGNLLLERMQHV